MDQVNLFELVRSSQKPLLRGGPAVNSYNRYNSWESKKMLFSALFGLSFKKIRKFSRFQLLNCPINSQIFNGGPPLPLLEVFFSNFQLFAGLLRFVLKSITGGCKVFLKLCAMAQMQRKWRTIDNQLKNFKNRHFYTKNF